VDKISNSADKRKMINPETNLELILPIDILDLNELNERLQKKEATLTIIRMASKDGLIIISQAAFS
jgi:chromatin remodeling complex protein RSC6